MISLVLSFFLLKAGREIIVHGGSKQDVAVLCSQCSRAGSEIRSRPTIAIYIYRSRPALDYKKKIEPHSYRRRVVLEVHKNMPSRQGLL